LILCDLLVCGGWSLVGWRYSLYAGPLVEGVRVLLYSLLLLLSFGEFAMEVVMEVVMEVGMIVDHVVSPFSTSLLVASYYLFVFVCESFYYEIFVFCSLL